MSYIIFHRIKLIVLFPLALAVNIHALDFTLNGKKHHIIDKNDLPVENTGLQIKSFYPWMETVEILELTSPVGHIRFTPENGLGKIWNDGLLKLENRDWLFSAGNLKLTSLKKISLWGKSNQKSRITVWSSLDDEIYRDGMKAKMILHGIELDWLELDNLHLALEGIGAGEAPDMILYDSSQTPVLEHLVRESRIIGGRLLKFPPYPRKSTFLNPDIPIPYLVGYDETGTFVEFNYNLQQLTELIKAGRQMIKAIPKEGINKNLFPDKKEIILEHHATTLRFTYNTNSEELQQHLLNDAQNLWRFNHSILSPDKRKTFAAIRDTRTRRFLEAWNRLGRLALSEQIPSELSAALIMNYMEDTSS